MFNFMSNGHPYPGLRTNDFIFYRGSGRDEMMPSRITSTLFLLFALFVLFESRRYPLGSVDNPGPGFLPMLLGITLGVMSFLLMRRSWTKSFDQGEKISWPGGRGLLVVCSILLMLILFAVLLDVTGYLVNVFLFFILFLRPISRQKWIWSLTISIGATLVAYGLFERWLMVPLPRGILFN